MLAWTGEGFDKHVGSSDSTSGDAFFNALWIAHTLLSKAPRALKRTLIFTRSEDPTGGNTTKRHSLLHCARRMHCSAQNSAAASF